MRTPAWVYAGAPGTFEVEEDGHGARWSSALLDISNSLAEADPRTELLKISAVVS